MSFTAVEYALDAVQGLRDTMEDYTAHFVAKNPHTGIPLCYIAVFDGHAGFNAAKFLHEKLHQYIFKTDEFLRHSNLAQAIRVGFENCDRDLISASERENWRAGSTATVLITYGDQFFCANVGDSDGIISKNNTHQMITTQHRPSNPTERELLTQNSVPIILGRVGAVLAVSRAFGDKELKSPWNKAAKNWVIASPSISEMKLDGSQKFACIASDGLWDVLEYNKVHEYIDKSLNANIPLQKIAESLTKIALDKDSDDNVSIGIVTFGKASTQIPTKAASTGAKPFDPVQEFSRKTKSERRGTVLIDDPLKIRAQFNTTNTNRPSAQDTPLANSPQKTAPSQNPNFSHQHSQHQLASQNLHQNQSSSQSFNQNQFSNQNQSSSQSFNQNQFSNQSFNQNQNFNQNQSSNQNFNQNQFSNQNFNQFSNQNFNQNQSSNQNFNQNLYPTFNQTEPQLHSNTPQQWAYKNPNIKQIPIASSGTGQAVNDLDNKLFLQLFEKYSPESEIMPLSQVKIALETSNVGPDVLRQVWAVVTKNRDSSLGLTKEQFCVACCLIKNYKRSGLVMNWI